MEQKRSIWKETLNYGIILGLIAVGFSLLTYMFDLTFKTWIIWPSLIISDYLCSLFSAALIP